MKKYLFAILALFIGLIATAQTTTAPAKITPKATSVVIDSTGMQYAAVIWQKLVSTGDYWLKPIDPAAADPKFIIIKYTQAQKDYWYAKSTRPADSKFFKTGQVIKPFKIKALDGKKFEAKDWAGKTVVINFWFIGCPPCRAEIPDLNRLALKYKDNPNVIFIAAALDDNYDVGEFVKANPLSYHLAADGVYIAHQFDISLYPTNLVIDKQGKVALHYSGGYQNGPYWIDKTIQESEADKVEM